MCVRGVNEKTQKARTHPHSHARRWLPESSPLVTSRSSPKHQCDWPRSRMASSNADHGLTFSAYSSEQYLQGIIDLISLDLSEPYSIFTYRYFINNWPQLCILALDDAGVSEGAATASKVVGVIVCKQDRHRSGTQRGYIAMLAVDKSMRNRGLGRRLVELAVQAMRDGGCDEAVLETEVTNVGALRLYEGLGFVRDKRLHRYYLNGNDAYRLKLWFARDSDEEAREPGAQQGDSASGGATES